MCIGVLTIIKSKFFFTKTFILILVEVGMIVARKQIFVIGEKAIAIQMINALDLDSFVDPIIVLTKKEVTSRFHKFSFQ